MLPRFLKTRVIGEETPNPGTPLTRARVPRVPFQRAALVALTEAPAPANSPHAATERVIDHRMPPRSVPQGYGSAGGMFVLAGFAEGDVAGRV